MRIRAALRLTLILACVAGLGKTCHATTITDPLTGSGDLNNSSPGIDDYNGADKWQATPAHFTRTGSGTTIPASPGTNDIASLAFVPAAGTVYSLSTTFNFGVAGSAGDWLFIAFLGARNNQDLFSGGAGGTNTAPFALIRTSALNAGDPAGAVYAFAGPAVTNQFAFSAGTGTGTHTLTLQLDTTGAAWKTSFFEDGLQVGSTFTYSTNPTLTAVSFGNYQSAAGAATNFSLTSVPEPASLLLCGLGMASLLLVSRRRRAARAI